MGIPPFPNYINRITPFEIHTIFVEDLKRVSMGRGLDFHIHVIKQNEFELSNTNLHLLHARKIDFTLLPSPAVKY